MWGFEMTPDLKELTRRLRETPPNVLKEREAAAAIDSLIAELEQAKKDAERYRLLVSQPNGGFFHPVFAVNNFLSWKSKAQYDAAIDAAIAKEQS